jgi:hypothetical protein
MNRLVLSLTVLLMILPQGCLTSEAECKKTEAPEINFGLLFYGSVQIKNEDNEDITASFVDSDFNMLYYKVYCSGKNNGPFTTEFSIKEDGSLYKKSIGYMSFRMDNKKDYIRVQFFIDGSDIGKEYRVSYDQLKAFDGANPNLNFTIAITCNNFAGVNTFGTESISLSISK